MSVITREQFIDLLERTHDSAWLDGLRSQPDSAAILEGLYAIAVQVSRSVDDGCNSASISLSSGGRPGELVLTLSRSDTTQSFSVPAGYPFFINGIVLVVKTTVLVGVGPATFDLPLQTRRQTEAVNTFAKPPFPVGASGSAISDVTAGAVVDTGANTILGPPGTSVISAVVASTDIVLGSTDWLSAIGNERGQQRQGGELEEDYRLRVRNIPDAITPRAMSEAVQGTAQHQGLPPFTIYEPFEDGSSNPSLSVDPGLDTDLGLSSFESMFWWNEFNFTNITDASNTSPIVVTTSTPHEYMSGQLTVIQGVLGNLAANTAPGVPARIRVIDATSFAIENTTGSGAYVSGGLSSEALPAYMQVPGPIPPDPGTTAHPLAGAWDDANAAFDIIGLMLSSREATAYFKLRPNFAPDDPDNLDSIPPGGPYYDRTYWLENFFLKEKEGLLPAGGLSPKLIGALLAVYEEANRKRAFGVQFDLELQQAQSYLGQGGTLALVLTTVWTLDVAVIAPGKFWQFDYIVAGHFGDPDAVAGQYHTVKFTFEDLSTYETDPYTDVDTQRITRANLFPALVPVEKRVIKIEGRTLSDGVNTGRMIGFVRALEITAPL